MAFTNYPYPSLSWDFQGIDFAMMPVTQTLAINMYNDGIRFVGRYLFSSHYPNGKGITRQEALYYINAGLKIFLYYEVNSTDALGGYSAGLQNGTACLAEAQSIGVPYGTPIYCCCDTGVTDSQASGVVMNYLDGFRDAFAYQYFNPDTQEYETEYYYKAGIYGGSNVMSACYNSFPDDFRCQAGAWGDREFTPIDIRQWYIDYNKQAATDEYIRIKNIAIDSSGYATWRGYSVDLCSANDITQMWGDDSPTPTPTPPTPQPTETSMPIWFYLKKF
ncbi:MAG: DUF1906 domain-containing protein [Methanobrevibacter sp.]|nr:DUF1906 domain-containing protein [Methanobrevibacter sp.]